MRKQIAAVVATLLLAACATPSQMSADAEVRRLCAIDGGIKVYETVKLPAEKFDDRGNINFLIPETQVAKSTDEFYYVSEIHYYHRKDPEVSRRNYKIVRRVDNKLLGELVLYGRGGGDWPGPWHGSSFTCPDVTKLPNFESSIFLKVSTGHD